MMRLRLSYTLAMTLVVFTVGCGGEDLPSLNTFKGKVTSNGSPVADLTITFAPADGSRASTGTTDASGNFELYYKMGVPGVVAGEHKVSASWAPSDPEVIGKLSTPGFKRPAPYDVIQEKYGDEKKTTLTVKVDAAQDAYELKLD